MLSPSQVSAVIVTRGDVDLTPVLESLIFEDVVVWDNSKTRFDWKTYGRIAGVDLAKHDYIYSQDDDIIHTAENQIRIIQSYEEGFLTGCMWAEWSDGARAQGIPNGYDDLVFMGSGSVFDAPMPNQVIGDYLEVWPEDDFFNLWCDTIVGVLAPTKQIDIRFEALPHATNANRMCELPNAVELKTEAIRRAREVRDGVCV